MHGILRSFGQLWPPLILAWALISLSLSLLIPKAKAAISPHFQFEHSNGVWQTWPLNREAGSKPQTYFLDRGSIVIARDAAEKIQETSANYTLGIRPNADKVLELDLTERWQRSLYGHQLALNLFGNFRSYQGSSEFASLENQFLLNAGKGLAVESSDSQDLGGQLSLEDRIALSHNLDLTLAGSLFQQTVLAEGFQSFSTQLETQSVSLEQRWNRGSVAASLQISNLRVAEGRGQGVQPAASRQLLSDAQLSARLPIASRLDAVTGWQSIRSTGESQQNARVLSGPTVGLIYGPYAAWSGEILLRSLNDANDPNPNAFGQFSLTWQRDSRNELTLLISRQIDLLAEFRSTKALKIPILDQQQSSVTSFLQWNHQESKHRLSLSSNANRQVFTLSRSEFRSIQASYTYNLNRMNDLTSSLNLSQTKLETPVNLGLSTRLASGLLLAWQMQMRGGLGPLGGRNFLRVEGDWQSLQENLLDLSARRLTLLLSLGQLGNF